MTSYYPTHARAITEPTDAEHRIAELEEAITKAIEWEAPVPLPTPALIESQKNCPQCRALEGREWPPSGLCERHYYAWDDAVWRPTRERPHTPYQVKDILRAVLARSEKVKNED